jgi:hypothetical protein
MIATIAGVGAVHCSGDGVIDLLPQSVPPGPSAVAPGAGDGAACPPAHGPGPAMPAASSKMPAGPMPPAPAPCEGGPCPPMTMMTPACDVTADASLGDSPPVTSLGDSPPVTP